jgi:iduronate 2-sulfatase
MGLFENTIIVVWGDHGWKLGEHGSWCKQTNYNIDTRVPLFIRAPGVHPEGQFCDQLTELVDLFPTLCDLAGITIPGYTEGISLKPMLKNPELELKSAVFSQYHQRPKVTPDGKRYMGYSMVTSRYHYVEWYFWDNEKKEAKDFAVSELYDNEVDPEENINIAGFLENQELVQNLSRQLKAGWRAALLLK